MDFFGSSLEWRNGITKAGAVCTLSTRYISSSLEPNSKHWFTTSFLEEGAGKGARSVVLNVEKSNTSKVQKNATY